MSRCLSFPPPGYEDLIELIKERRGRGREAKEERKEEEEERGEIRKKRNSHHRSHKRRKSNNGNNGRRHRSCCDTKKDLELEEEELEEGEIRQERNSHHRRHTHHRSNNGSHKSRLNMKKDHEPEGPEGSTVTEELHQLVSDSMYDSCDNSNNVRRKMSCLSPESCHEQGSLVWAGVSIQDRQDEPSFLSNKPVCSITKMDPVLRGKSELACSQIEVQFCSSYGKASLIMDQFLCSFAESTNTLIESDTVSGELFLRHPALQLNASSDSERGLQDIESTYGELFPYWVPLPMMSEHLESESLEWLFAKKAERLPDMSEAFAESTTTSTVSDTASEEMFLCHPTLQLEAISKEKAEASSCSERGLQDIKSTFRELFARWAPSPTTSEHLEPESIEWLFGAKAKRLPRTNLSEAFNARSNELCHSSSAKFPTAQYLPQADIHAFPFKIPF